jgi:filamentous hemagglutinin family protein
MLIKRPLFILSLLLLNTTLFADIVTDGTMGQVTTLAGPNFMITEQLGQQRGGNLFHSFQTFNVNTGESATFTSPSSVTNILARVTGGNQSFIDGTLHSDANLYLLNPNGILFGQNARLDVSGSFHASTADYLRLEDDGYFSATHPDQSVLTAAPPEAFGFLNNHAPIIIEKSELGVDEGKTLSIIGGDVQINDGTLYAPSGRINLAAVASKGEVVLSESNLAITSFEKLGKITLSNSGLLSTAKAMHITEIPAATLAGKKPLANIDVSGLSGGQVFIRAGEFVLNKGLVFADTYGNYEPGLDIDVFIDGNMYLYDGAKISADLYGKAQGGHIKVKTTNDLIIRGEDNNVFPLSDVSLLQIFLKDLKLRLEKSSAITATSWSNSDIGRGGDINIDTQVLDIRHGTIQTATLNAGNSGDITVNAGQIKLWDNGFIHAVTNGSGQAGDINVTATNEIFLSNNSGIVVAAGPDSNGKPGDIELDAQHLRLNNIGFIIAGSEGSGDAGSITIKNADTISLTDVSRITTLARYAGGGDINIEADERLSLANNSKISARALGIKPHHSGGNLTITNPRLFTLDNSQLLANAVGGDGGDINIEADKIRLKGNNQIDVSSELGINGQFFLNNIDLSKYVIPLSINELKAEKLVIKPCAERSGANLSRLVFTGPEILPEVPHALSVHIPSKLLNTFVDQPLDESNLPASRRWLGVPCTIVQGFTE